MKIVLVVLSLDPQFGAGTAERTRWLALYLSQVGCKCTIVALGGTPWLPELNAAGIDVYSTRYVARRFPIPLPNPITIWRIVRSSDVIHVMGYWYMLAVLVCQMARIARTPFALCPAGELTPLYRDAPLKKTFYWLFGRRMIRSAALIIATTGRERDEILGMDPKPVRITISPNGIAPSVTPPNCSITLPATPFILFLGRLTAIKGPDLLVEAFAKICKTFPDVRLVVAGPDFGLRPELEVRVRNLGLDERVTFLGFVDEQSRQHLYQRAAFLVIPSRSEVMSMVALEAAAMGVPVLLTDRCGFEEVERVGGGLVVPADIAGLAEGLARMLNEGSNLPLMGERLCSFVLTQYAWMTVATELRLQLAKLVSPAKHNGC